jgi:hypothetical protein
MASTAELITHHGIQAAASSVASKTSTNGDAIRSSPSVDDGVCRKGDLTR